jgi:hypothetical protein
MTGASQRRAYGVCRHHWNSIAASGVVGTPSTMVAVLS